ncbi:MAG TPA: ATP-binding protein, partial [Thermodesulfovibrionales bacterium]|nr:ATP-binding protein [Thermodesulfovibrionales bacterium]
MIRLTQRRLTIRFVLVLMTFTVIILTIIFIYFHQNIVNSLKRHLREEIQNEFIDQYHRTGLDTFKNQWEEYHFEILNANGDIVVASPTTRAFYTGINRDLLASAFLGSQKFEMKEIRNETYLVAYFPLDEKYSGRIAASFAPEIQRVKNFLNLLILTLPWMLLLSYLVSRYLVKQAMKPISDVFTFQEHFSSSVSHELRSPLASLKGNFEVSLRKERTAGEYRDTISFGLTEVDRIIHLLNDLYLIASSRSKPLDLFKEEVDMKKLIGEVVGALMPRILARGIRVDNAIRGRTLWVCDEALMRRVFENLLNNAVKYTPEGGSIVIRTFESIGKRMANIANTCQGIGNREIPYLFEPFYRGKAIENRKFEGKGLGLFVSRYIVRSHGGEITAKIG